MQIMHIARVNPAFFQAKNKDVLSAFWKQVTYVSGTYDTPDGFIKLNDKCEEIEKAHGGEKRWI